MENRLWISPNNDLEAKAIVELLKNYALFAMAQKHPNEAELANLTDKLLDLIREVESLPPALRAEAKELLLIAAAKEYKLIKN